MGYFDSTVITHLLNYLHENTVCLLYVVEIWPENAMYFTAYFTLVKDVAEAYGSWAAFSIIAMSLLAVVMSIHQLMSYRSDSENLSSGDPKAQNVNNVSSDTMFTDFNLFKYFRR